MSKRTVIWIVFAIVFGGLCYFMSREATKQEHEMEQRSKTFASDMKRMRGE